MNVSRRMMDEKELAASIGRITMSWGDIHFALFQLFTTATGMPKEAAEAIFFSLRTDAAQRDITAAACRTAFPEDLYGRINNAIKRVGGLAGERNVAIHAMWATHYPSGQVTPSPWVHGPFLLKKDDFDNQFAELQETLKNLFRELLRLQADAIYHVASLRKDP
jgi:hypothetical protein